jgi:hypothetical protein
MTRASLELWWRGAHHRAGTSTLAGRYGGVDGALAPAPTPTTPTLVVCARHEEGLASAQSLARRESEGLDLSWCAGLVVVDLDARRRDRGLDELVELVGSAYVERYEVPWVAAWAPPRAGRCRSRWRRELEGSVR